MYMPAARRGVRALRTGGEGKGLGIGDWSDGNMPTKDRRINNCRFADGDSPPVVEGKGLVGGQGARESRGFKPSSCLTKWRLLFRKIGNLTDNWRVARRRRGQVHVFGQRFPANRSQRAEKWTSPRAAGGVPSTGRGNGDAAAPRGAALRAGFRHGSETGDRHLDSWLVVRG
jgi:hypothetical protein